MYRTLALLSVLVLATVLAPPASAQIGEKELILVAKPPEILNPDVLEGGRLPAGVPLQIRFRYDLYIPPVTVCPLGTQMTTLFTRMATPFFATTVISPAQQTKVWTDPLGITLSGATIPDFATTMTVVLSSDAPAGGAIELGVSGTARSSVSGTLSGCNLKASAPTLSTTLVVAD